MTTRFNFSSIDYAKKLAKKLQKLFLEVGHTEVPLSQAQEVLARMTGHLSWHELAHTAGSSDYSFNADLVDEAARAARREQQIQALRDHGLSVEQSTTIVTALHPSNPSASQWQEFDGGQVRMDGSDGWWVGPNKNKGKRPQFDFGTPIFAPGQVCPYGPNTDYCIIECSRDGTGAFYVRRDIMPEPAESMQAGMVTVDRMIVEARTEKGELGALHRTSLPDSELSSIDNPWGEVQSARQHAYGIVDISCDHHGGWRVPRAVMVERVHPLFWRTPDEEDFCWYEEDCEWAMIAVSLPALFTTAEVDSAIRAMEMFYPDVFEMFQAKPTPSKADVKRALRELEDASQRANRSLAR